MPRPLAMVAVLLAFAPVAWWYLHVAAQRRLTGRRWPHWRSLVFIAGTITLAVGMMPVWGDGFSAHVLAHLLIGMLAPLLLVVADPLGLQLGQLTPPARRRVLRGLNHSAVRWVTKPAVAWLLAVLTPWLLWLTPLYPLTERHAMLHGAVHLHFLAAGLLFATVVLGVGPVGHRVSPAAGVLLIALALPTHALLGLVLLSMDTPLIAESAGGLADQRRGAVLMWLAGDLIATVTLGAAFPRWFNAEQRRARREDAAVARSAAAGGETVGPVLRG